MFYFTDHFKALRTLITGLSSFQTWVGSADQSTLDARVTWPHRAVNLADYPYINLSPGRSRFENQTGNFSSSSSNQFSGSLWLRVWDSDDNTADPEASFEAFDAAVSGLLQDLFEAASGGPLILMSVQSDDPPIVHSHDNAEYVSQVGDPDPVWHAAALLSWGVG